jgi:hypothetical protein
MQVVFALFFAAGLVPSGYGQTNTDWKPSSGAWSNPANWDNGVPNGNFNAFIGTGGPLRKSTLDINATVNDLTLNSGAVVIASGNSLSASEIIMTGSGSSITGATGAEVLDICCNQPEIVGHGTISNVNLNLNMGFGIDATGGALTLAPTNSVFLQGVEVDAGSTLHMAGPPIANYDPATGNFDITTLDIKGTLELDNTKIKTLTGLIGGAMTGVILDGSAARIVNQFGQNALATLSSTGQGPSGLNLINGATLQTNQGLFIGSRTTVDLTNGSSLTIGGGFTNQGQVTVDHAKLTVNGGVFNGDGDVSADIFIQNHATLNVHGDLQNTSGVVNNVIISGGSMAIVNGNLTNSGGSFIPHQVTVDSGSTLTVQGNVNNTDLAALNVTNGSLLTIGKNFNNPACTDGSCFGPGTVLIASGSQVDVKGMTTNGGGFTIDGTSVLNSRGGFTQTAGSTVVDGLLKTHKAGVDIQGGTLSGTGTVNGNMTMGGRLSPGDPTGAFTLNGNYTQTSTGTLSEQVGWLGGSNATLFNVNGKATLSGTLDLLLLSGYNPMVGDSFILMTFRSDSGTFSSIDGLDLGNNLFLELSYDPHDIRVEVESGPNAALTSQLTASQLTATPEPGSIILLLAGCLSLLAFSGKRLVAKNAKMAGAAV